MCSGLNRDYLSRSSISWVWASVNASVCPSLSRFVCFLLSSLFLFYVCFFFSITPSFFSFSFLLLPSPFFSFLLLPSSSFSFLLLPSSSFSFLLLPSTSFFYLLLPFPSLSFISFFPFSFYSLFHWCIHDYCRNAILSFCNLFYIPLTLPLTGWFFISNICLFSLELRGAWFQCLLLNTVRGYANHRFFLHFICMLFFVSTFIKWAWTFIFFMHSVGMLSTVHSCTSFFPLQTCFSLFSSCFPLRFKSFSSFPIELGWAYFLFLVSHP